VRFKWRNSKEKEEKVEKIVVCSSALDERADRKTNNGTGDDGVGNDDTAHWKQQQKG
jgi:hypothetical protein